MNPYLDRGTNSLVGNMGVHFGNIISFGFLFLTFFFPRTSTVIFMTLVLLFALYLFLISKSLCFDNFGLTAAESSVVKTYPLYFCYYFASIITEQAFGRIHIAAFLMAAIVLLKNGGLLYIAYLPIVTIISRLRRGLNPWLYLSKRLQRVENPFASSSYKSQLDSIASAYDKIWNPAARGENDVRED